MSIAVKMVGITKTFPGITANDRVSFDVRKGEVHGLLGENGAGKTVLMSILYGMYAPDEGEIFVYGKKARIGSSSAAMKLGIGMVHQHFMLVPSLTVAENIVLGREPTRHRCLLDVGRMENHIKALSDRYRLEVDPGTLARDLPVGLQQRVEILKALFRGAEILILDEPTSVLAPQEIESLFGAIRALRQQGKSVIFITHKLKEVCKICDRITVLKRGRVVGTVDNDKISSDGLAEMMVGREVRSAFKKEHLAPGKTVLHVEGLSAFNDRKMLALKDTAFEVHEFEVLGLAGVEGNGQTELVEVLTGLRNARTGEVYLNGTSILAASPHERIQKGIASVPEDRQREGLILDFSIQENLVLGQHDVPPFATGWFTLNLRKMSEYAQDMIQEYSIQARSKNAVARHLSGGTQQRVVVAREFSRKPKLIIACQPTRGLDIGATEYVRRKLVEMRDHGCAILLISADLDEILSLSDRIAVIYEGKIMAIRERIETNELDLGLLMTGGKCD